MGKSSSRVNITESSTKTSKKVGTKKATIVQLSDTEQRDRNRRSKQATRISLETANNDLADEVISLRDRVETLEKEKNEQLNQEDISLLKQAITQVELCIIQNYGENMSEILDALAIIRTKVEGLENSAVSLTNQNNDILAGLANLSTQVENSAGGKPNITIPTASVGYIAVTDTAQINWNTQYGSNTSNPTYPYDMSIGGPLSHSSNALKNTFGRYGYYYRYVYSGTSRSYRKKFGWEYRVLKFPITAEARANWAGISTVSMKWAVHMLQGNRKIAVVKKDSLDSMLTPVAVPDMQTQVTLSERNPFNPSGDVNVISTVDLGASAGVSWTETTLSKDYFPFDPSQPIPDSEAYFEVVVICDANMTYDYLYHYSSSVTNINNTNVYGGLVLAKSVDPAAYSALPDGFETSLVLGYTV